jgi:hypothetical protein
VPTTSTVAPAAPAPPTAEALAAARDVAIGDLLLRYKSAIEGRNFDALKRLWPGLAGIEQERLRDELRRATSISVGIVDPQIVAKGDAATVTFVRHYEVVIDGRPQKADTNATMEVKNIELAIVDRSASVRLAENSVVTLSKGLIYEDWR